eukprot:497655-Amphidinium_carterae.1
MVHVPSVISLPHPVPPAGSTRKQTSSKKTITFVTSVMSHRTLHPSSSHECKIWRNLLADLVVEGIMQKTTSFAHHCGHYKCTLTQVISFLSIVCKLSDQQSMVGNAEVLFRCIAEELQTAKDSLNKQR